MSFETANMKKYYLPGLHQAIENPIKSDFYNFIDKQKKQFPKIFAFINDTDKYLNLRFPELNSFLNREKRLLVFETPNRVKVTHEYDFTISNSLLKKDELYFLSNPSNRLNWLKIFYENERIIIGRSTEIKSKILSDFEVEIKKLLEMNITGYNCKEVIYEKLWNSKSGYPCFILFSSTPKKNFILKTEYFESIRIINEKENTKYWLKKTINSIIWPYEERNIEYQFKTITNLTAWLYCKAPVGFHITIKPENNDNYEINDNKPKTYKEADPEVCFSTFISRSPNKGNNQKFNILILIPESLKVWYFTIHYLSLTYFAYLLFAILNRYWIQLFKPVFNNSLIFQITENSSVILSISLAIFASIITTRSWLITEETILRKYSKVITYIATGIIICTILLIIK